MKKESKFFDKLRTHSAKVAVAIGSLLPTFAFAADRALRKRLTDFASIIDLLATFLTAVVFGLGIFLTFSGIKSIWDYIKNPQQGDLTKPIGYTIVGGIMMGFTAWVTLISDTANEGVTDQEIRIETDQGLIR